MTTLVDETGVPAGPLVEVGAALENERSVARGTLTTIADPNRGEIPVIEHPLRCGRAESGFESPPGRREYTRSVFGSLRDGESGSDGLAPRGAVGDR